MPALVALASALVALLVLPAAGPGAAPGLSGRYLLVYAANGAQRLAQSPDGVRWTPVAGFAPGPGERPTALRRGSRLYVFDALRTSPDGITAEVRRFRIAGRALVELPRASVGFQLSSPEEAAGASEITGSFLLGQAGELVALYALRLEPDTNACPVQGRACVKLRTATEAAGSDGTLFTGDLGNRAVITFDPADGARDPAAFAVGRRFAVLLAGPGRCLRLLDAADLHGAYEGARGLPGGCLAGEPLQTPSGVHRTALREHWLYGVREGTVVRGVARRLDTPLPARRIRALRVPGTGAVAAARFSVNAP